MSQRDVLTELRTAHVAAPAELRARVRLIAADAPQPRRSRRRLALLLVPAVAAAVAAGVFFSTRPSQQTRVMHGESTAGTSLRAAAVPAPSAKRAQRYGASLRLQVRDVPRSVTQALRIVGSLSGFASSVHIDTSKAHGSAFLTLRVPRSHVQTAVARLSRLGTVMGEQVDIQDVQAGLNATDRLIARLQRELRTAPPEQAPALKARIQALQRQRAAAVRAAHFATVRLSLSTPPVQERTHHHYVRDALPWLGGAAAALLLLLALRGLGAMREARLLSRF